MSNFEKTMDELLNDILTDYQNQEFRDENGNVVDVDISQGSLVFVKSACMASALWGLYKYQEYISKQIFPDTADTINLEHHAWIRGISRKTGESDKDLLTRLIAIIRQPPAGGNKQDYKNWAIEVDEVANAYVYTPDDTSPLPAPGLGEVIIVVVASTSHGTGNEVPDSTLLSAVESYINSVRPVTAKPIVKAVSRLDQDVTMTVTGANANIAQIIADITSYLNSFEPDQTLYTSKLVGLATDNGAEDVNITIPATNITPATHQMIRAGTINVT